MTSGGEDILGIMSLRSAKRFPYFINSNLENIIGKDFYYHLWDDWVASRRSEFQKILRKSKLNPPQNLPS